MINIFGKNVILTMPGFFYIHFIVFIFLGSPMYFLNKGAVNISYIAATNLVLIIFPMGILLMNKLMKIKDLPLDERPREKLLLNGAENLSDAELLAIFLRCGNQKNSALDIAKNLINEYGISSILQMQKIEFCQKPSLGQAKYATIKAIIELAKRHYRYQTKQNDILSLDDAVNLLTAELHNRANEIFSVIFLNAKNKFIKYQELFTGGNSSIKIDKYQIAKTTIKLKADKVILAHNHPSGDINPSHFDIEITKTITNCLSNYDIEVIDHIIIGEGYYSFLRNGLI